MLFSFQCLLIVDFVVQRQSIKKENVAESAGGKAGPAEIHLGGGHGEHGGANQRQEGENTQENRYNSIEIV